MADSGFQSPSLLTEREDPLIGLVLVEDGREIVRYFADEATADASLADELIESALNSIGAFSDLDWDELAQGLDQIRRDSSPTPPITF